MVSLYKQRRQLQKEFNINIIRSIADWTTITYIAIPGLLFAIFFYRDLVLHIEESLLAMIPLFMVVFCLFLLIKSNGIRTFLQPADRLFLIQQSALLEKLKRSGFVYSVGKQIVVTMVVLGLMAPLFIQVHQLTWFSLLALELLVVCAGLSQAMFLFKNWARWQEFAFHIVCSVMNTCVFVFIPEIYTILLSLLMIGLVTAIYRKQHISSLKHFDQQLALDQVCFYKWQSMLFSLSLELRSMQAPKLKKKPWLFRKSKRLFKRQDFMLEELFIKTILRNANYRNGYIRLIFLTLPLYFVLPTWGQVIVLGLLYLILKSWLKSFVTQVREHKFFVVLHVDEARWQAATKRLSFWMVDVIGIIICCGIVISLWI